MKHIPNIFTLLNLFFGCCAIVFIMQNGITIATGDDGAQFVIMPEEIWIASLFIGLAAVVDFLDGFVARLFKATSELGKQLDSLADVVSFGVAPSLIVYHFLRLSYAREVDGLNISWTLLTPAFFIACAGAYRLAKFNIATDQIWFQREFRHRLPVIDCVISLIYWYSDSDTIVNLFATNGYGML
jgi:CDP-diacylglycerol--serine O-phosphatidyltransferase